MMVQSSLNLLGSLSVAAYTAAIKLNRSELRLMWLLELPWRLNCARIWGQDRLKESARASEAQPLWEAFMV